MAAKGRASQVNVQRSIAELEAELEKRTAERDRRRIHNLSDAFAAINSSR